MSQFLSGAGSCIGELLLFALVIGIPLWFVIRAGQKEQNKQKALLKDGLPGNARIIEVGASRTDSFDQKMHVALRLEVTPQTGESFKAITAWAVEPAHTAEIRVGESIPVKIAEIPAGKSKTRKFKSILPNVSWATLNYWEKEFKEENMKTIDDEVVAVQ